MDAVGEKLVQVAVKELGYSEHASGYTKFGAWYAKAMAAGDSYYTTAPWCDMFLAWAAEQAGVTAQTGEFAATIDHAKWFEQQDAFGHTPEPGAIVFFAWDGSHGVDDIAHVGLVESVSGSTLHTIEANTSGTIARRTRDTKYVVGYGYPAKVQVVTVPVPYAAGYTARHAAPAPTAGTFLRETMLNAAQTETEQPTAAHHEDGIFSSPLNTTQATALSGLVTLAICGSLALAVGKATAKRVPTPTVPEVRVRKRGKHHRGAQPVELPAEVSVAEIEQTWEDAEAGTVLMPVLSLEAAQEAEDQVFWGKISAFKDDEELSFWDDLHETAAQSHIARDPSVPRRHKPAEAMVAAESGRSLADIAESEGILDLATEAVR